LLRRCVVRQLGETSPGMPHLLSSLRDLGGWFVAGSAGSRPQLYAAAATRLTLCDQLDVPHHIRGSKAVVSSHELRYSIALVANQGRTRINIPPNQRQASMRQ